MAGAPDGSAGTGSRAALDDLLQRMANGDIAAASEWTAAYRTWSAVPPPPRFERFDRQTLKFSV